MEYRAYDGGRVEIYTYADHLTDFGVLCRGKRDVMMGGSFWRVDWRKAKRMQRIGWRPVQ